VLGGYGEFAFLFYENGTQIGAHLVGRGDNIRFSPDNNYGAGSLIGKLSVGGFFPNNNFRGYSFVEGGVGFGGGGINETFAVNVIFGGGGGIDFFFHQKGSLYIEVGYLQHYINRNLIGGALINIGTRGFF
jgi:hypothetical protein